ncbi:unnamed protein product [Linum tenue]|uniref:DUF4283 domain-containing protein n=1 Tax=Linum tenue TaxID=586396 RepID=A0AAV0JMT1_9ROSI|nr:unnamed protein product [Linum tenue]
MFCREWRSALVVKALGRSVSYTLMAKRLFGLWAKAGTIQVTSVKNGYFLVRFTSGIDYERAVTGGPWLVGDNYLTVHPWSEDFNPYEHEISSTLVWARLLDLPIHYFHQVAVMKIGSRIGKPIRVDQATSTGSRSDYARVCVQVDITRPLLSQFTIKGKKYFIQYEGLEKICLKCGTYSERNRCACQCPPETSEPEVMVEEEAQVSEVPEALYGEWMIAKRRSRTRKEPTAGNGVSSKGRGVGHHRPSNKPEGSRFTALDTEEVMETVETQDQESNTQTTSTPLVHVEGSKATPREIPNKKKQGNKEKVSNESTQRRPEAVDRTVQDISRAGGGNLRGATAKPAEPVEESPCRTAAVAGQGEMAVGDIFMAEAVDKGLGPVLVSRGTGQQPKPPDPPRFQTGGKVATLPEMLSSEILAGDLRDGVLPPSS